MLYRSVTTSKHGGISISADQRGRWSPHYFFLFFIIHFAKQLQSDILEILPYFKEYPIY